jgi:hypothetical protein
VCIALFLDGSSRGLDVVGEPGQALQKAFTSSGTARHHVPNLVLELGELKGFGDFLRRHGYKGKNTLATVCIYNPKWGTRRGWRTLFEILLVGKY